MGLLKLDFIDWLSFKDILPFEGVDTTFAEFCAQYSAVQTNWAYTYAAIIGIIILLIKKNKKWYWYLFLIIFSVMSVTSVGMHTANYGAFEPGVLTTKLLASYVDMSFTELTAWCGVCSFAMEFYQSKDSRKKRNMFLIGVSAITVLVLGILTYEVFVLHDRPLYFGGNGAPMDGKTGGMSIAEVGCIITILPMAYLFADNFKKMTGNERALLALTIGVLIVAAVITALWGDNEIADFALGNFHGHSTWHMLGALMELVIVFWIDQRETNKKLRELKGE